MLPPQIVFRPRELAQAFPARQRKAALEAASLAGRWLDPRYTSDQFTVRVDSETVLIPQRLLLENFRPQPGESAEVRWAGWCLLSRSTSGYERQVALREVVRANRSWTIPFVIRLIGEYVIEILDDIEAALPDIDPALVRQFFIENPDFIALTRARVMSYWNEYYRWRFQRADYVGFRLIAALETMAEG